MSEGFRIIKYLKNISNLENTNRFFLVIFTGIGNCDCATYNINDDLENNLENRLSYIKYFRKISDILCINIDNNILTEFYKKTQYIKELIEIEYYKNSERQIIFLTHSFGSILAINVIKLIDIRIHNLIKLIMIEPTNESSRNTLTRKKGVSRKKETFIPKAKLTNRKCVSKKKETFIPKAKLTNRKCVSKEKENFIPNDNLTNGKCVSKEKENFIPNDNLINGKCVSIQKKTLNMKEENSTYSKIFNYIKNLSSNIINCKVLIIISFNKYFFFNILNKINNINETKRYSNINELKKFYSTHLDKIDSLQKIINYENNENIHIVTIPTEERNPHFLYKNHKKKIINYIKKFINHDSYIDLFESLHTPVKNISSWSNL